MRESSGKSRTSIPITVRQLEAIIRLSEAVAKIHLSPVVRDEHVDEAHRLFKVSTLTCSEAGLNLIGEISEEDTRKVKEIETRIKNIFPIGSRIPFNRLREDHVLMNERGNLLELAVHMMAKRGELVYMEGKNSIIRKK